MEEWLQGICMANQQKTLTSSREYVQDKKTPQTKNCKEVKGSWTLYDRKFLTPPAVTDSQKLDTSKEVLRKTCSQHFS
jgi:hypothetical protein